tara:strand:+ start:369 stop:1616 length:1248 start_codon:yes stop_codon:yes gene_type:complete
MKNLFLTFLMLTGFSLLADELYVNSSGLDGTYYTIQEAVDAANDGDNIYISTVGTYSEDVLINKTVFLVAGVPDEEFTLSGEIQITAGSGPFEATIIGMNNGSVVSSGADPSDKVTVNVISSFISSVNFGNNYDVHLYDCTVYNSTTIRNGQIKGSTLSSLTISADNSSSTDTVKIMGNYLNSIEYNNTVHYFEICNNMIDGVVSADNQDSNFQYYYPFYINQWNNAGGGTNLISNNTIMSALTMSYNNYIYSYGIRFGFGSDGQNIVVVNNYITTQATNTTYSSYDWAYTMYAPNGLENAYIANNYYYENAYYPEGINGFDLSSLIDNQSGYNWAYNSTTGEISGGDGVDLGLDWIEYRDIDNTTNDIGTAGGPHTWSNYNTIQGKAAVIDLELPFQLYIGGVHNVKAKSFHKN